MKRDKVILIGCDESYLLNTILNSFMNTSLFSYNLITATRYIDAVSLLKSMKPDLLILSFKSNQDILNTINYIPVESNIPVLCMTKRIEDDIQFLSIGKVVFTYLLGAIYTNGHLCTRISSIFALQESSHRLQNPFVDEETENRKNPSTRDMSRFIMELDQKSDLLAKLKDKIKMLYPRVDDTIRNELISIVNNIKSSLGDSKLWDDFKLYFEKTNPEFLLVLAQKHPELTTIDLKYCCYLKMNMSNDDIRNLLGINQESVRTHKYRLKKKMALPKSQDLVSYLRTVEYTTPAFI